MAKPPTRLDTLTTRLADLAKEVGLKLTGLKIDHNAVYGGYKIIQQTHNGGGERSPFGDERFSYKELMSRMNFVIRVAQAAKGK